MTSHRAETAIRAYRDCRRHRTAAGALEMAADATLAAGGLLIANASLSLSLGLPVGRVGLSLGSSMVCAGLAWITRHRGRTTRPNRGAAIRVPAPQPVAIHTSVRRAA